MKTFNSTKIDKKIINALLDLDYENPTEIQQKVIPIALKNKDILATAQSGSGKTAAFLIPILENLANKTTLNNPLKVVILTPTRELAKQIIKAIDDYGKYIENIKRVVVFGGVPSKDQVRKFQNGVDIIVATPGRLMEHIRNNTVNLSSVDKLVVDEVDTMLAMGFLEDIETIFSNAHQERQIMMFSATLNQNVKKLAKEFLNNPVVVEVVDQRSSVDLIDQQVILVDSKKKAEVLSYLIGSRNYESVLVFVNTKKQADLLVEHLELDGLKAACIHGDVRQTARAKALRKLKEKSIKVLVATDIAARGIDIERLPVVINYALPQSISDYTHRIGRTGRAGNEGTAITLLSVSDYAMMAAIEKELILEIPREVLDGFELEEKQPRKVVAKVKAHEYRKKTHTKNEAPKRNPKVKRTNTKKRKTTKRDTK